MTIGEYVRSHDDIELAVILLNWMLTIVRIMGGDINQLDLKKEFFEITAYIQSPMTKELESMMKVWGEPSEIIS